MLFHKRKRKKKSLIIVTMEETAATVIGNVRNSNYGNQYMIRGVLMDKGAETNTVVWMDSKISIHIFCPDSEKRIKMVAVIANQLSLAGEIAMLDHSPMTIKQLQANYKSDIFKDGQILTTVHFGLLKYRQKKHRIVEVVNIIH